MLISKMNNIREQRKYPLEESIDQYEKYQQEYKQVAILRILWLCMIFGQIFVAVFFPKIFKEPEIFISHYTILVLFVANYAIMRSRKFLHESRCRASLNLLGCTFYNVRWRISELIFSMIHVNLSITLIYYILEMYMGRLPPKN